MVWYRRNSDAISRPPQSAVEFGLFWDAFNAKGCACVRGLCFAKRIWSTLIDKSVLSEKHNFAEMQWRRQPPTRNVDMPGKM